MSYYAANNVPISTDFTGQSTFPTQGLFKGFDRLDVFANGTDAIVQFLMDDDPAASGWQADITQEIVCPMGFHSIPMERSRFLAVRFKVWGQTLLPPVGTVHIRCFS